MLSADRVGLSLRCVGALCVLTLRIVIGASASAAEERPVAPPVRLAALPELALPPDAAMAVALPDVAATLAALQRGWFGAAWRHPETVVWSRALTALARARLQRQRGGVPAAGSDPLAPYQALRQVLLARGRYGRLTLQALFDAPAAAGRVAADLAPLWKMAVAEPAVEGYDSAYQRSNRWLLQRGAQFFQGPGAPASYSWQSVPTSDRWDLLGHAVAQYRDGRQPHPAWVNEIEGWCRCLPGGIEECYRWNGPPKALGSIDPAVLDRVDERVDAVLALGIDGRRLWNDLVASMGLAERVEESLVEFLGEAPPMFVRELLADWQGTAVVALDEAWQLQRPRLLIALPRSESFDEVVAWALDRLDYLQPPAGEPVFLTVPWLGREWSLILQDSGSGHWLLATEATMIDRWRRNEGAGLWTMGKVGRQALSMAGAQPQLVFGYQSGELLAGLAERMPTPAEERPGTIAWSRVIADLAPTAMSGAVGLGVVDGRQQVRFAGPFGGPAAWFLLGRLGSGIDAVAAEARPWLGRPTLEDGAAYRADRMARWLRSELFAAMVQFAGASFNDRDGDGRGEYGFLPQLAGAAACFGLRQRPGLQAGVLSCLPAKEDAWQSHLGYHLELYLSDGDGAAISWQGSATEDLLQSAAAIDAAERFWICYAWPQAGISATEPAFCITQDGRVHVCDDAALPLPPAWNAAAADTASGAAAFRDIAWPVMKLPTAGERVDTPIEQLTDQVADAVVRMMR